LDSGFVSAQLQGFQTCAFAEASPESKNPRSKRLQYFLNRSKRKSANPKSKGLWGESATNARCKGLQRALVADGRERTAVASRFRLALAAALRLRGFTQAVPPLRLPLPAANARPKQART